MEEAVKSEANLRSKPRGFSKFDFLHWILH